MTMCTYFGTFRFIIILWTFLQDAQAIRKSFKFVEKCPFNEAEWKMRAAHTTCNGSESYHCLLTEGRDLLREQCTDASLFTSGFCPIFTNEGYLQWSPCKDTACPTSSYRSDEVYQYPICYENDNPKGENTGQGSNNSGSTVNGVEVIIVPIVLFFILLIVLSVFFYKRNQFRFRDKVQQLITDISEHFQQGSTEDIPDVETRELPEQEHPLVPQDKYHKPEEEVKKLKDLLKYLVHILKQELGVNDLKEKIVIHSKSVNEHLSEQLKKDLQSLKDINDYSQLDTSLVFALLRNFCEGIKPPSRGWDYKPPDDETHLGADIERIRSMWNKYCDDDLEFKNLDAVYNRMKQKYGTIAIHGDEGAKRYQTDEENVDGFALRRGKLQSIKLYPDCTVEKGIVITDNITQALKILISRNVVILKGVVGCGKTHALKAIQNHFQGKNWKTVWVESENVIREISHEKPTIHLCDNFFGTFGSSVFSQDAIDKSEMTLKELESSKQETKVVVGIHTHVYDEVKKNLKLDFLCQKSITVEMDNLSEAETLLIFKEQLERGHCKRDSNCWFKTIGFQSVLDKLSTNQGHIGGPFLSLMYCNQHEMFSDFAFAVNPVRTLLEHIKKKMKHDSSVQYYCLVYLMCVQRHNFEEEPKEWSQQIYADITKHYLMDLAKTSDLVQVDTNIVTLGHELLTVVLFKSIVDTKEIFLPVLQNCESDVFLQLLRPTGSTCSDIFYEYTCTDDENSRDIGKMCAYRLAGIYYYRENSHPLMTVQLIREKYCHYLRKYPKWLCKNRD